MKSKNSAVCLAILSCITITAMPYWGSAEMKPFAAAESNEKESRTLGIAKGEVPLLEVVPGPGKELVTSILIDDLQLIQESEPVITNDAVTVSGKGWRISVFGDGSKVAFLNEAKAQSIESVVSEKSTPVSDEDAIKNANNLFYGKLSRLIKLKNNEKIVPYLRKQHIVASHDVRSGVESSAVVGTLVVFRRIIDNTMVIGPGSTLSVEIANDGTIVLFKYDWAEFVVTNEMQKQLSQEKLLERSRTYNRSPSSAKTVSIPHFNCGYYDRGVGRDDLAPIQTACTIQVSGTTFDGELYSTMNIVPAGEIVEYDAQWAEAASIAVEGEFCAETAIGNQIAESIDTMSN